MEAEALKDRNLQQKIWDLIKNQHVATLVTINQDGTLDSRPMGCLQNTFDGTLWFMTFEDSPKISEVCQNQQVLVSYVLKGHEFVSISGRGRVVDDRVKIRALWREGFRVWFPDGPTSSNIALIAVDVETAEYWINPTSLITYAYYYVRMRLTGKSPSPSQIVEHAVVRFSQPDAAA